MNSQMLQATSHIAGLVASVLGHKLIVLQISKLGHLQTEGEISGVGRVDRSPHDP